jgi:hypothetical protein
VLGVNQQRSNGMGVVSEDRVFNPTSASALMIETPISPFRRRMIEDMTVRKFAGRTQENYIRAVKGFSAFLWAPPDTPGPRIYAATGCIWWQFNRACHRGTDGPDRQARLAAHAAAQLDDELKMPGLLAMTDNGSGRAGWEEAVCSA